MVTLSALLAAIPQPDVAAMARAQQHIDGLLKPPGSLGRLETLAVQLAGLRLAGAAGAGGESDCGHVRRPWRLA
ncbi:hypothetical protein KPZU09_00460 [Klebsiella pneumoniae]|uniref:Nicotinate-nucleotide--dimethylbenzimidazole phosphoribosyltransferase n=1 Tax=Klebsiella pneumoniae TaxID=573 RepID=A0A919HMK5_KLEPN|nr:hypothetical protein KPZU09_00460 [Klebsiella pneumoniae]